MFSFIVINVIIFDFIGKQVMSLKGIHPIAIKLTKKIPPKMKKYAILSVESIERIRSISFIWIKTTDSLNRWSYVYILYICISIEFFQYF